MYDEDEDEREEFRVTRDMGIGGSSDFKVTGVRKLLILAIAPSLDENYYNCSVFIKETNINNIIYTLAADLKVGSLTEGTFMRKFL